MCTYMSSDLPSTSQRAPPGSGQAAPQWGAVLGEGGPQPPLLSSSCAPCGWGGACGGWRLLELGGHLAQPERSDHPSAGLGVPGTPPACESRARLSPPTAGLGAGSAARGPRAPGNSHRSSVGGGPSRSLPVPGRLPGPRPLLPLLAPRLLPQSPAAEQRSAPQVPSAGGSGVGDPRPGGDGAEARPLLLFSLRAGLASSLSPRGLCPPEPGVPLCWL